MKRIAVVALCAVALCGCSSISGTRTLKDGSVLKVSANRFLWSSEGIDASTEDQQGFKFGLKVAKSSPDAEAIKAIGELVIRAMAAGAAGAATGGAAPAVGAVLPAIAPSSAPVAPAQRTLTIRP